MSLGIVTVTVDYDRAAPCLASWQQHARVEVPCVLVEHGDTWLATTHAFGRGVDQLLREHDVEIIACLHDDLVIFDQGWDAAVIDLFTELPEVGLVGVVGIEQLGVGVNPAIPYALPQLARDGVRSLLDGETHTTSRVGTRVASVDGVALIGRRAFWSGFTKDEWRTKTSRRKQFVRPWAQLHALGFRHHWTDDALSCLARRGHWDVYYLPVRGRHLGGLTIRDPRYAAWVARTTKGGDRELYEAAHRLGYDTFRDVLPLRPEVRPAPTGDRAERGDPADPVGR